VHSIEPHHSAYVAMILSKLEGIEVFDRASRGSRSEPTRDSRMGEAGFASDCNTALTQDQKKSRDEGRTWCFFVYNEHNKLYKNGCVAYPTPGKGALATNDYSGLRVA